MCILTTDDPGFTISLPVSFSIRCASPSSDECACVSGSCGRVEYASYSEYASVFARRVHVQISDSYCCALKCGVATTVFLRDDGAIVFVHDDEHVHIVKHGWITRRKLRALLSATATQK